MYEEISNAQIDRIGNTNFSNKKDISKLLLKDRELIYNLAFKLSEKKSLSTKELNHWLEVACIELGCEKLRREGILMRTSKGWRETKLGREKRTQLAKTQTQGGQK